MADPLPPALKIPEVSRFVNRANQLRTIKPAIAYWCEYRAVNQIVGKSLHTTGDDAFSYTKTLIDRLEATKVEHATDDSIVDNDTAKAYVEQFAQQTFDRADRTLRADKVTRQTADTFDAAATFFDVLHEWGEPDPEVLQKIKFAKWNAARILKALREGKDPNESNPKQPEEEAQGEDDSALQLDPNDPDVQQITLGTPQRASVQVVPDAGEPMPGPPPQQEDYFPQVPQPPPLVQPSHPVDPAYHPSSVPSIPPEGPPSASSQIPPQPSPQIPTKLPSQFTSPPPRLSPTEPSVPPTWSAPPPTPSHPQPPVAPPQQPTAPVQSTPSQVAPVVRDHEDLDRAQKHAKWAISALNFEDVPTAVQELRNALAALGTP